MMKDQPPLRLSEWSPATPAPPTPQGILAPPHVSPDADPLPAPPVAPPADPDPSALKAAATTETEVITGYTQPPVIFQGFDLLRIVNGIRRRWFIPVFAALGGAILGALLGAVFWTPQSTVSVRLMFRSPKIFATSSEAYTPGILQGATLLGALKSPQVAREVATKLGGDIPANQLVTMVSVEEVRKTDFVDLVFTTPFDAKRTAQLASLWGEEALKFTSHLQSDETREMKSYLEEQLLALDADLQSVNEELSKLRLSAGVVDADREIDSKLRSLGDAEFRLQTVITSREATDRKLSTLRAEIRKHSPGMDELRTEEKRLAELAEYYTELNPIYQEASDRVERMREALSTASSSPEANASQFVGTEVGNSLYLQILEAEAERESLALQEEQLTTFKESAREQLADLPKLQMEAAPLLGRAVSLRIARDNLLKRLKEVTVFHDISPGYYRLFKAPAPKDVLTNSRLKRMVLAGFLSGVFFFGLGLAVCTGLEFIDTTVRTPAEAAAAFAAPCLARVGAKKSAIRAPDLWASVIGPLSVGCVRSFWSPIPGNDDDAFWSALLEAARHMNLPVVIIHLDGPLPPTLQHLPRIAPDSICDHRATDPAVLVELPPNLDTARAREIIATIKTAATRLPAIWLETSGLLQAPVAKILREFPNPIVLCTLNAADRTFWQTRRSLLGYDRPVKGIVALG